MWCSSCRADVAAELSTDNRRMLCARCQSELGVAASTIPTAPNPQRVVETERDARELLARWSAQNLLDAAPATPSSPLKPVAATESKSDRTRFRFDPPRMSAPPPLGDFSASSPVTDIPRAEVPQSPVEPPPAPLPLPVPARAPQPAPASAAEPAKVDPVPTVRADHPPVAAREPIREQDHLVREALQKQLHRKLGWSSLAGQLFAYGGVALLTCGTVLIVWSYFGGPAQYLPTGLLTAAVGQMVLFLGVVTLISSGMEQTVHEVTWRIDHLAEEIYHMGVALDELEHSQQHRRSQMLPSPTGDATGRRAA